MRVLNTAAALVVLASGLFAQTPTLETVVEAAHAPLPALKDLLIANFPNLKTQGAAVVWGQDYLFALQSDGPPTITLDGQPPSPLTRLADSNIWYRLVKMRIGVTHSLEFDVAGKAVSPRRDIAGYNPDSYPKPGVPKGTLSAKKTIASELYPGSTTDYWVYTSPGVDPNRPAPLMVWQDGEKLIGGDMAQMRLFTVTENLIAQKLIPPMIHVMVSPGAISSSSARNMRSIQYDTVTDKFGRFLLEEVLADVGKAYKLRPDAYSRAISGESSGAICAWNVAWFFTDQFSRVHSTIGSYTALQWHPEQNLDGGNIYPSRIRREPKKNIRIWQSDGTDDIESAAGSWPLQGIELANSLKLKGYDFHFRFGDTAHDSAQAALDLPESLAWLWRDYDPAKTEQIYERDPAEQTKPVYRVKIANRDSW